MDLAQAQPSLAQAVAAKPKREPEAVKVASTEPERQEEGVNGSIWLDALKSVLKNVPVMNAVMQPVDHRLVPILDGRIEGAAPDKVFFFKAPDDSLRGFRICQGDTALVVPAHSPIDGAVMLVEYAGHRNLRKIKRLNDTTVLLQTYQREYEAETFSLPDVTFVGRVVRVDFEL